MNFNYQRYTKSKSPFILNNGCQTDRPLKTNKNSQNTSFMKENHDPNSISNTSIIRDIQDIEKLYQEKIEQLKQLNVKLLSTIEFMEKTIEQQKEMLQEKQLLILKQQHEISSLRQLLSQNTQQNIQNLKTEIEDERIKTQRLRFELQDFKQKFEKEKPLVQLFKKIEQTQEDYNQQNKTFMKEVIQLLEKPRVSSSHRDSLNRQHHKRSSFYV